MTTQVVAVLIMAWVAAFSIAAIGGLLVMAYLIMESAAVSLKTTVLRHWRGRST